MFLSFSSPLTVSEYASDSNRVSDRLILIVITGLQCSIRRISVLIALCFVQGTLLVLCFFVCQSSQRPQFEASDDDDAPTTTEVAATEIATVSAEETAAGTGSGNNTRVTEAAAVSVQTTVNVSRQLPFGPGRVFGDFRPSSHHYRPDGGPAFDRPSPPVTHEAFYEPQHFRRPADGRPVHRFPLQQPDDRRNVVFPLATQVQYSATAVRERPSDNETAAESGRARKPFVGVLPQHKPIKHDAGDALPNFSGFDGGFYERPFGKYQTNDVLRYPADAAREPKPYHTVVARKK